MKCSTMALKFEVSVFSTVVGTRRDGLTRFFFTFTAPDPRHKPPLDAAAADTAGSGAPVGNAEEYFCKPELLVFAAAETLLLIMPQEVAETALVVTDVASALLISDAAIRRMSSSGFMPAAK